MTFNRWIPAFVGATCLATAVAQTETASADYLYDVNSDHVREYETGNDDFAAKVRWVGRSRSYAKDDNYASSRASEFIYTQGTLFGKTSAFIQVNTHGSGYRMENGALADNAYSRILVAGDEIHYDYNSDGTTTVSRSLSKTFFEKSAPFMVGPIPMVVTGRVSGRVYGELTSTGYAERYLGKAGSVYAKATSQMGAGASVSAALTASSGIPEVAEPGVTTSIKLIGVDITPNSNATQVTPYNSAGQALVSWANELPMTYSSMSGYVDVWGKLLGKTYTKRIFSWKGKSWTSTLVDDSGTRYF